MQQILSILGWIGTALVFAAVAIRFIRPEYEQYGTWAAWGGLALVVPVPWAQRSRRNDAGVGSEESLICSAAIVSLFRPDAVDGTDIERFPSSSTSGWRVRARAAILSG